jgi:hypothetical protein
MAPSAREAGTAAMSVPYPEFIEIPELDDLDLLILNDLVSNRIAEVDARIDAEHLSKLMALKEKIIVAGMSRQRALNARQFQNVEEQ